jgi:type 1 glutamine amidotransferase
MKPSFLQRTIRIGLPTLALSVALAAALAAPKKLLVVTATKGFRHSSIPTAEKIIEMLGGQSKDFTVDFVRGGPDGKDDAEVREKMSPENLAKYDGVIFANTTGDLAIPDKEFFLNWLKSGKAFVGMHSCSDTYHGYPPFIQMLGAEFLTHKAQVGVNAINQDPHHPATVHLGPNFAVFDEIYLMKNFDRSQVHGLLTLDKHPNDGYPGDFPIAWAKEYGKGRVFYTSLGHREDVWDADPNMKDRKNSPEVAKAYQQHVLGGIQWALGLKPGDAKPQSLAYKVSAAEAKEGFKALFDGVNLDGWHYRNPSGTKSWSAQDSMLVNTIPEGGHGSDLVSDAKFKNFTVRYEYLVPKGANSGFYLRGRHEIQILDDGDAAQPSNSSNGSLYNHTVPSKMASKKAGEWQTVEATMIGNKITVILNGQKIIDNVTCDKGTGGQLDDNVNEPGPFLLQGDHGAVAFRNLRVKTLP